MIDFLQLFQIFFAVLLILLILVQGRGAGLSSPFGGSGETFQTRRGLEKVFYYLTIFVTVLLTLTFLAALIS